MRPPPVRDVGAPVAVQVPPTGPRANGGNAPVERARKRTILDEQPDETTGPAPALRVGPAWIASIAVGLVCAGWAGAATVGPVLVAITALVVAIGGARARRIAPWIATGLTIAAQIPATGAIDVSKAAPIVASIWIVAAFVPGARGGRVPADGNPAASEAMATVLERNRRLEHALNATQDGLWDRDIQKKQVYRSQSWAKLRGYEPDEIGDAPEDWASGIHPDDAERVLAAFEAYIAGTADQYREEYRIRCKDGSYRWILDRGEAVRDHEGRAVRILGIETDVDDRRRAERRLLEVQRNFEEIVSSAMDAIVAWDHEFRIVVFNTAAETMFGIRAGEAIGSAVGRLLDSPGRLASEPGEAARARNGDAAALRTTPWNATRSNGEAFSVEASVSEIVSGDRPLVVAILRDQTRRLRFERLLASQAKILEAVASNTPLAETLALVCAAIEELSDRSLCSVLLIDDQGLLRTAAAPSLPPSYCEMIDQGVPIGPLEGTCGAAVHRRELVVVEDIETDPLWAKYRDLARPHELRSCWSSPVTRPDGEPIGSFAIYSHQKRVPTSDDVDLIQAASRLVGIAVSASRSRQELRESEDRFRLALEAGRLGTWRHDFSTGLIQYDARAREQRGMSEAKVDLSGALASVHPDDRSRVEAAIARAHDPRTSDGFYEVEERVILPDGSIRWVWVFANVRFEGEGAARRPTQAVGVVQDVTERKLTEQALLENDRRKTEFLAMLGHELRNPLSAIRNAVDLMKLEAPADPKLDWSRDVIEHQTSHLGRLVDDLLDIGRINQGKINLRKQALDARPVLRRAFELARSAAAAKRQRIRLTLPEEPLPIEFDEARLQQVVGNLLTNAVKYTDENGEIELSAERTNKDVYIRVRDDGIGIAREHLSKIFGLFAQVDASIRRSDGGLGIGLTLVHGLVEMHGGRVSVRSEGPGKGSTFEVVVPLLQSREKLRREESAVWAPASQSTPDRPRLLVVEDSRAAAEGLARLFRHEGFEVVVVHDGLAGVEALANFPADTVVSDIGLPRMNGYEMAKRIRATPGGSDLFLVAISGYGQEDDHRRALESGFDRHLTKPVDFRTLLRVVQERKSDEDADD